MMSSLCFAAAHFLGLRESSYYNSCACFDTWEELRGVNVSAAVRFTPHTTHIFSVYKVPPRCSRRTEAEATAATAATLAAVIAADVAEATEAFESGSKGEHKRKIY